MMDQLSYLGQCAHFYAAQQLSIIPLKPASKEPLGAWRHRQKQSMSVEEALEVWKKQPDANIGIVCGAINHGLAVIDLDNEGAIGWADLNLPPTPGVVRTLHGEHRYFRAPGVRNRSKVAGLDVDVRGEGGYVVAPPSIHPSANLPYAWWPTQNQPPNFAALPELPPPTLQMITSPRFLDALEWLQKQQVPNRHPDHPDDSHKMLIRYARKLVQKFRLEECDLLQVLLVWNAQVPGEGNQWTEAELQHKVDEILASRTSAPDVDGLLERYALIEGTAQIWDLKLGRTVSVQAVKLEHPGAADAWLRDPGRRLVAERDIVFAPGGCAAHQINRFVGLPCHPDPNKPHQKIVDHLWHLCGQDQTLFGWVISWLALPLQKLGTKMQSALVLVGPQGAGKTLLGDVMRRIYGDGRDGGYAGVITQDDIESTFNGWLSQALFVVAEEVVSSQNRRDRKNLMKHFVTGSTVRMNEKYEKARDVPNHFNMMFLSNEATPLLLEQDDRRHCIVRVPPPPPAPYFDLLLAEIEAGGAAGFLDYLQKLQLQGFRAGTPPPMTAAKQALIEASSPPETQFLLEWIGGQIPAPNDAAGLYATYKAWCLQRGLRPASQQRFKAVAETLQLRRQRVRVGGTDHWAYLRPSDQMPGCTG